MAVELETAIESETAVECKYESRCEGNRRAFGTECPGSEDCPEAKNYEFFEKCGLKGVREGQEDKRSLVGYFNNGEGI